MFLQWKCISETKAALRWTPIVIITFLFFKTLVFLSHNIKDIYQNHKLPHLQALCWPFITRGLQRVAETTGGFITISNGSCGSFFSKISPHAEVHIFQSLTNLARTLLGSSWSRWCISDGFSISWLWSWNSTWRVKMSLKRGSCWQIFSVFQWGAGGHENWGKIKEQDAWRGHRSRGEYLRKNTGSINEARVHRCCGSIGIPNKEEQGASSGSGKMTHFVALTSEREINFRTVLAS